ncbi:organic cation transporter protein-like isoform X2 [Panulirus ornatus]|uniref:organic cation transporter protein-like isoform X2 n=1 Tax=Panulirus ornatus TaxID=150431 RepID=UPI003A838FF7
MDETAEVVGGAHKKTSRQLEENGGGSLVGVAEAKLQSNGLDEDAPVGGAECSSIEGSQLDAVLRWADRRGNYERLLVWAWVAPFVPPGALCLPEHTAHGVHPQQELLAPSFTQLLLPRPVEELHHPEGRSTEGVRGAGGEGGAAGVAVRLRASDVGRAGRPLPRLDRAARPLPDCHHLRVIEESPRWLVCQGRLREASCVLRRMAHMNGFHVSTQHVLTRLRKVCGSGKKQVTMTEASHGPLHMMRLLVRYPRMAARTALVTICWTVNMILYYNTTMKYPYVFVNPFLGWFSISVMEVPANIMVLFLLKKVGRRPLHAGVMAISTASLLSTACVLALGYEERQTTVAVLVLVAKFSASMTFLVIYLQAAELHPTPVRTCATGGASLVAIACNVFSPTIVAMARPWHSYLLLGSLGLLGVLSASLLPETAGRPLPQTLDDAENFARRRSSSSSSSSSVRSSPRREEGPTVFPSSPPPSVEVSQPISSSHLLGTVKETII